MVSAILVLSGEALSYIGWFNMTAMQAAVIDLSMCFIVFSIVFITVGWYFFKIQTFIELSQWTLLLPIGVLGLIGGL